MLSIQLIRQNPGVVREALAKRRDDAPLDQIVSLDEERRRLVTEAETLRAGQKQQSREYAKLKSAAAGADTMAQMAKGLGDVRERIRTMEEAVEKVEVKLQDLMLRVPNIPDSSVPVGEDEGDNVVLRTWGEIRCLDFAPLPHWDLGESLDIIDFARGVKLSGSRFYILKGLGALLQRALITFMLDLHVQQHGYTEIYPPCVVKKECLVASSNLPKFADNLYHDVEDDFWLVPTAEVPLTNVHRDEILEAGALPIR
ncbi:MAG: serine--tRNA ligase, partial [Chloroflexi bacterium]|nr:serine--tRNA ligase [Chloroflexota bacterium]